MVFDEAAGLASQSVSEKYGATILQAPSATKNASGERDPEKHQTRKVVLLRVEGAHRHGCKGGALPLGGDERGVPDCHMLPELTVAVLVGPPVAEVGFEGADGPKVLHRSS
jgi:hypothetical protein